MGSVYDIGMIGHITVLCCYSAIVVSWRHWTFAILFIANFVDQWCSSRGRCLASSLPRGRKFWCLSLMPAGSVLPCLDRPQMDEGCS